MSSKPFKDIKINVNDQYVPNGLGLDDKRGRDLAKIILDDIMSDGGSILATMKTVFQEVETEGELAFSMFVLGTYNQEINNILKKANKSEDSEVCPDCGEVHEDADEVIAKLKKLSGEGAKVIDASDPKKRKQMEAIIEMLNMLSEDKDPVDESLKRRILKDDSDRIN